MLTDGDYPEEGTTITVVGRYETYTTPYYDYFHLVDGVRESKSNKTNPASAYLVEHLPGFVVMLDFIFQPAWSQASDR